MKKSLKQFPHDCVKHIYLCIIYFGILTQLISQAHHSSDSLFIEINTAENDTIVLELYQMLISNNWYYDMELAKACTDTSLQIALENDFDYYIANSSHNYGLYHRFQGNADSAIYYFNQALDLYGPLDDSTKMTGTLFNLAVMQSMQGNNEFALSYFIDYKKIHEKEGNQRWVCEADNAIGLVFLDMKDFVKSEEYLKSSLQCAIDLDNSVTKSYALGNLQSLYVTWDKYEKSIEYGRQALQIEKELENIGGIGLISNNLSLAFNNLNELDSALFYAKLGISSLEKHGEAIHLAESYTNMGFILSERNLHSEAISYFDKSLNMQDAGNFIQVKLKSYQGLTHAHEQLGNFKTSLGFNKKYTIISDSLLSTEKFEIVSDLELKYETAQKDNQLKDNQITFIKQNNQKKLFLSSALFMGLLAMSIFGFMKNRLKTNKILALQESEFQLQRIDQLEKEKKILSMSRMLEGQESERKRIAQDLHDGLGGLLATIKIKFGIIQKELAALESINVYQQTSSMIDDACTEVRKIAHNMMPDSLTKLGLVEAVRDIAEYTSDINIKVINLGLHKLSETQEIMLYRVIQEFLNNTRKHAKATEIIIQFSSDEMNSIIYLEDNGKGFDVTTGNTSRGLGLKSMESRINFLGGTCELDSVIGVGTTLQIHLPKS